MPKVTILGRVFPAYYQISFSKNSVDWLWPQEDLSLHFDVVIENSIVTIECILDKFKAEYTVEIYRRGFDIARSAVNLASFGSGIGFSVIFEKFDINGRETMFAPQDPSLALLCNSFSLESQPGKASYGEMWNLVVTDPALFQALDDLIVSITVPHHASVNCARAIEGLRHLIAPGATASQAWEQMRNALRLDRNFIQLITDTSTAPRHGDRSHISGVTTTEIVRRSWLIMDRFFEYRKRGNSPLPATDFPLLTS